MLKSLEIERKFFNYNLNNIELYIIQEKEDIVGISFYGQKDILKEETELIKNVKTQLEEYFNGKRKDFNFPIKLNGTDFQKKVLNELKKIPYGETCTYKDIAEKIGKEKACRAVGNANNKNPIAIVIPCHRVIGTSGKLVGYAGGVDIKEKLLSLEQQNKNKTFDK